MATVDRDRNLLFGIFAAQLRGVRPERIIEVGAAWATDPSRSLAERMVKLGLLTEADRKFLEALVEGAVQAHGGDSALALETLGGAAQIEHTFSGTLRLTPSGQVEMVEREGQAAVPGGARELNIPEETPGRYSRISVYGKGGMGRVLLVHDENMDRDVAMKELLPHPPDVREPWTPVGHTAAMVARFLREARLTGLLEHPSIVPVYELGRRADGSLYYTMKLVRGKTFLQAIRDGKGLAQRLTLLPHFLNLCHAIAYAHSRGVIHRDIKPANVMVGDFGETVVLDWGIAKAQGTQDPHETELTEALTALRLGEQEFTIHTEAGEALGTPHYMPPEQAQGRINEIDKRSDVYSLGAVLYEMLTAKTPHSGKTTKEIIEHVVREPVRPVLELEQDAPAELAGICDKCLDKDPAHRYQSARELADEIERFLSGALVRSYKYNLGQLLRHYYRRHRAVLNTALAGAAALLLLAVYSYVSITRAYHREQEQRQIAEIAREKETEAKEAAIVARDEEEKAKDSAERQLYIASILLARQSIEGQRYDVAMEALDRAPAAHRNWEWGYYNRLCHLDEHTLAGHEGPVVSAEYSPDGTLLVTASDDHTARLWSSDGSERAVLRGHTGQLRVATFSPAGHRVATASEDGLAILWDSATGKEIVRLKGHDGGVNAVEFSPTGEAALTASADGTARLWNASTGEEQGRLQGHSTNVRLARFNPEGTRIVTASQDGTARLWDAASGQEIIVLGAGSSFRGARFSNDGQRLLLWANTPPKAFLFNGLTGESQKVIEDLGGRPCSGGFSPDNLRFAVGCIDGHVSVYSAADAMPLLDWSTDHRGSVHLSYAPNSLQIVSGGQEGSVRLWNAENGELISVLSGHSKGILNAGFSPDGTRMVTASTDDTAKIWKTPLASPAQFAGHTKAIIYLSLASDGKRLLSASSDGTARLWNLSTGEALSVMGDPDNRAYSAKFNADGTRIVTSNNTSAVQLWEPQSGQLLNTLQGHSGTVSSVGFNPDGARVVSASSDGTARVWDVSTGTEVLQLKHPGGVNQAAFDPQGQRIVTACGDGTGRIWEAQKGELLFSLTGHTGPLTFACFTPDGAGVVTTSEDNTARIWNAEDGSERTTLRGHTQAVTGAAFSRDARLLGTRSFDGSVRIWNLATGALLHTLRGHTFGITTLEFSRDGTRLLTAASSGEAKWWDIESETELVALLPRYPECRWALLTQDETSIVTASENVIEVWQGV